MDKPMVLAPAAFATATLRAVALKGNAGPATNGIAGSVCTKESLRIRFRKHDGIKMGMYVVFILFTTNIKPVITDLTGYGNLPQAALWYDWLYSAVVTARLQDLCQFFLKMSFFLELTGCPWETWHATKRRRMTTVSPSDE